ncbi:hypothetical protein IWZ01DRAFT_177598 [Phyllosticta capitalensis]
MRSAFDGSYLRWGNRHDDGGEVEELFTRRRRQIQWCLDGHCWRREKKQSRPDACRRCPKARRGRALLLAASGVCFHLQRSRRPDSPTPVAIRSCIAPYQQRPSVLRRDVRRVARRKQLRLNLPRALTGKGESTSDIFKRLRSFDRKETNG